MLLVGILYFIQERFIFHPERLPMDFRFTFREHFHEIKLKANDGNLTDGLLFKKENSKGVVFYFKGNTRSIKGWSKFAHDFLELGFDVFLIDYPGFGKSVGKHTEAHICRDACDAYRWLMKHYPEKQIVIYGRSFGAGIAARVASEFHPSRLVLDSPYYSFIRLAQYYTRILPLRWILKYKLPLNEYLGRVRCPVYILHGTRDRIIPFSHSLKLLRENPGRITLLPVAYGKHNNLPTFESYHRYLHQILEHQL